MGAAGCTHPRACLPGAGRRRPSHFERVARATRTASIAAHPNPLPRSIPTVIPPQAATNCHGLIGGNARTAVPPPNAIPATIATANAALPPPPPAPPPGGAGAPLTHEMWGT